VKCITGETSLEKRARAQDGKDALTDSSPTLGSGIFGFLSHRSTSPTGDDNSKIAPSQNKKHSLQANQVRDKKKLTPRKGGFFASSPLTMDMENTAGEAMDDLLRAGAEASFGAVDMYDFDDGFALLDESTGSYPATPPAYRPSPRIDPALLLEDAARHASEAETEDEDSGVEGVKFNPINAGVRAGEEGDVEDNASATPAAKTSRGQRGRGRKKAMTTTSLATRKPAAAIANTKSKVLKPAAGTRTSTRIAKTQLAASPAGKTQGKAKAAQLQAWNRRLMSARAATLRGKKAKKVDTKSLRGSAGGRRVRLRNWRGEVIDEGNGKGVVVVYPDEETDGEGYERC
jgi:hypothetical protein